MRGNGALSSLYEHYTIWLRERGGWGGGLRSLPLMDLQLVWLSGSGSALHNPLLLRRYEVLPCDRKENEALSARDPDYEIVPSGGVSDLGPREPDYETLPHRYN